MGDRVVSVHGAPCGECQLCRNGNSPRCMSNPGYFYGMMCDGGYQQYTIQHHNSLVTLPDTVTFSEGCFLCCTAAVSLRALKLAGVKSGDIVLITGATGGVGVHAIQVATAMGAKTVCVTSNPEKVPLLIGLGAGKVIVSDKNLFHKQVYQEVGGMVDIVLELVGAPTFHSSFMSVKPTGVVAVVGNVSVGSVQLKLGRMILSETKVLGSSGATKEDLKEVLKMVERKQLKPVVWKEFELSVDGINHAHNILKSKGVHGRIVLRNKL